MRDQGLRRRLQPAQQRHSAHIHGPDRAHVRAKAIQTLVSGSKEPSACPIPFPTLLFSVFDVSYNQLAGTLPTALTAVTGSNFVGNCFPGYPPIRRCDGYYIGATGDSCTTTCANAGSGMTCSANIVTNNAPFLFDSLLAPGGVTCAHPSGSKYVGRTEIVADDAVNGVEREISLVCGAVWCLQCVVGCRSAGLHRSECII